MKKYKFPENNEIEYTYSTYMPMAVVKCVGIPYDREWFYEYCGIDDKFYLISEGYSGRKGVYGLGPILVNPKDIEQYEIKE